MIARIALVVLLAVLPATLTAQPSGAPDRAEELLRMQFNSRAVRPSPGSMDGARATAIYKRFSDPAARSGASPQGAPTTAQGPSTQ
jgi:hypothetical protein